MKSEAQIEQARLEQSDLLKKFIALPPERKGEVRQKFQAFARASAALGTANYRHGLTQKKETLIGYRKKILADEITELEKQYATTGVELFKDPFVQTLDEIQKCKRTAEQEPAREEEMGIRVMDCLEMYAIDLDLHDKTANSSHNVTSSSYLHQTRQQEKDPSFSVQSLLPKESYSDRLPLSPLPNPNMDNFFPPKK